MFSQWIMKLRQKPKHIKDNIAFSVAGVFTTLVAIVWVMTVPKSFFAGDEIKPEAPRAFTTLINQVKEQVAGVKAAMPEIATSTKVEQKNTLQQQVNAGLSTTSNEAQIKRSEQEAIMAVQASTTMSSSNKQAVLR